MYEVGGVYRSISVIAPAALYSLLSLLLTIFAPIFLLFLTLINEMPTGIFSPLDLFNSISKLDEVMLILIPLGFVYFLSGLMFSYKSSREGQVPQGIFIGVFCTPFVAVFLAQIALFFFLFLRKGARLAGWELDVASVSIVAAITCFIWLDLFMSIARALAFSDDIVISDR
jgi:ABC-type nickel/cobalt efflux system permease component RcnA